MGGELSRLHGWEARLSRHIVAHLRASFRWGKTDCAMFSAGAVEAISGVDIAYGFRGYRSEAEGLRKVQEKGFDDYEAVFAARLTLSPVAMLNDGDIVAVEQVDRAVMGVYGANGVYVMGPSGLGILPVSAIVRGYAI